MKTIIAALAALALVAPASIAFAEAAPAAAAAPAKLSVETTTIGDLVANPASHAVLEKDLPALLTYEGLEQIKGMTLRDISKYPQANLDDARLATIQSDLDAASAPK